MRLFLVDDHTLFLEGLRNLLLVGSKSSGLSPADGMLWPNLNYVGPMSFYSMCRCR
jgi:hypothetical protein